MEQCSNQELIRVLRFLDPIFHPEKEKKVIMRMGSMIVAALFEEEKFNWASIIQELLIRQVSALGGKKGICVSSYLFHLYRIEPALTPMEREEVDVSEEMILYGCKKPAADEAVKETDEDKEVSILEQNEPVPTPNG